MGWVETAKDLANLDGETVSRLNALTPMQVPAGTVLFSPGDAVKGYIIVLKGRVSVSLTGSSGREILLYAVTPGQSCIQSTLGLMGGDDYTAEAISEEKSTLVLLHKDLFLNLIDESSEFQKLVFSTFSRHMQTMMHLLERVAFQRVECRLASHMLDRADQDGFLFATQQELAIAVGSVREVISRKLDVWSHQGWVKTMRGKVQILDKSALLALTNDFM
ncbi:MAG TPA: Crp/Fnr family transcriptional regulator [Rhodobacteraceae bacterium]|jgi:CRP/FNR family transcriptional regulator|nr:Crp/Fnr family transcriptional regulator [Paracoccaceae bacterium]